MTLLSFFSLLRRFASEFGEEKSENYLGKKEKCGILIEQIFAARSWEQKKRGGGEGFFIYSQ